MVLSHTGNPKQSTICARRYHLHKIILSIVLSALYSYTVVTTARPYVIKTANIMVMEWCLSSLGSFNLLSRVYLTAQFTMLKRMIKYKALSLNIYHTHTDVYSLFLFFRYSLVSRFKKVITSTYKFNYICICTELFVGGGSINIV